MTSPSTRDDEGASEETTLTGVELTRQRSAGFFVQFHDESASRAARDERA